ncbi:tristetraprolin [Clonorchis sinensis]|uniref:Tristetraprolin n=1 Tax=Clonorchis sinensis TaxID=79923 RepID=H2KV35_CLOSI|nr:tristetraprolin [Clonorchis sinensis]
MMQAASRFPLLNDPSDVFPENVLRIVDTAWAACLQGTPDERVVHTSLGQTREDHLMRLLLRRNAEPFQAAKSPPASPDSGIECDIPYPRTEMHPSPGALSAHSEFLPRVPHNPAVLVPKPRPLLRQRESYFLNPVEQLPAIDLCSLPKGSTKHPRSGTPMQVHKRQHMPRKQDAIYNARYKTQPCLHYQKHKRCPLGENCHFAHGPEELLHPQSHPKYRTRMCMNFLYTGTCPFGKKCYFVHPVSTISTSHFTHI